MPNLPWATIAILTFYVLFIMAVLTTEVRKALSHCVVWTSAFFKLRPRPAVIAAGNRGLHQRDQRNDHQ